MKLLKASILFCVLISSVVLSAENELPSWRNLEIPVRIGHHSEMVRSEKASSKNKDIAQDSMLMSSSLTASSQALISDLALSLKNDPLLIYTYVRNNIEFTAYYGEMKGSIGTILDKSGGNFDQVVLLHELLTAAGFNSSLKKVRVTRSKSDLFKWLKVDENQSGANNSLLQQLSLSCGVCTIEAPNATQYRFTHLVVDVSVNGQSYTLDPSFKLHVYTPASFNLNTLGFNKTSFLNAVSSGSSVTPSSVRQQLDTYTTNVQNSLLSSLYDQSAKSTYGGWTIVPFEANQLPNETVSSVSNTWAAVPVSHAATLRVKVGGIDITLESRNIYGKPLYLKFDGSYKPELYLENTLLSTGNSQTQGSNLTIDFSVDLAYYQNSFEYGWQQSVAVGGIYSIMNAWGEVGQEMVKSFQNQLLYLKDESTPSDDAINGYTLAGIGINWLYSNYSQKKFRSNTTNIYAKTLYAVGISGTTDSTGNTGSPYVDIGGITTVVPQNEPTLSQGMIGSAFEHGVMKHAQGMEAVSTARLLDLAASNGIQIFEASSSNWASVKSQLIAYSPSNIAALDARISNGNFIILPKRGDLTLNNWSGAGYFTSKQTQQGNLTGFIIDGGLSGGFSSVPAEPDSSFLEDVSKQIDNTWEAVKSYDPINLSTGDFLYYANDISVGSGVNELTFSRSYNSSNSFINNGLGKGWSHNHQLSAKVNTSLPTALDSGSNVALAPIFVANYVAEKIEEDYSTNKARTIVILASVFTWLMDQISDNVVYIDQTDNGRQFVKLNDGTYLSPQGKGESLIINGQGNFEFKDKHGLTYKFNSDGQVGEVSDRNLNTINYSYSSGLLTGISNSFGNSLTLIYNGNNLNSVQSNDGRTVSFQVNNGLLEGIYNTRGFYTSLNYNSNNNLKEIYTPEYPNSPSVFNEYNSWDKIYQQTSNLGGLHKYYIVPFYRAEEQSPLNNGYAAYFNKFGQMTKRIESDGTTSFIEYDGLNRKVNITYPEGNKDIIEYDDRFNPITLKRTAKPGSPLAEIIISTQFSNDFNLPIAKQDALGNQIDYFYDLQGNLERVESPVVEADGQQVKLITYYTYNVSGLVSTITHPNGRIDSFTYNSKGELTNSTVDSFGLNYSTIYQYHSSGDISRIIDPLNNISDFVYDQSRNLILEILPLNATTEYQYDKNDRNISVSYASDDYILHPSGWYETNYTYSKDDKIVTITDPNGDVYTNIYDIEGNVVETLDEDGNREKYFYDSKRRLTSKQVYSFYNWVNTSSYGYTDNGKLDWVKDGNNNQTDYHYDGFDRLLSTNFADGSQTSQQYNPTGTIQTHVDRDNNTTLYQYDSLNRLINADHQSGNAYYSYYYNLQGLQRHVQLIDQGYFDTQTLMYDNLGRLTSNIDGNNKALNYEYNANNVRTKVIFPDNQVTDYVYDALNRIKEVKYNNQNLITYFYNTLSQRTLSSRANGSSTSYSYTTDGNIEEISHQIGASSLGYSYTHKPSGKIEEKSYLGAASYWLPQNSSSYSYFINMMNQYTNAHSQPVWYDNNGNYTTDGQNNYEHNTINQLTAVEIQPFLSRIEYRYDALGRRAATDKFGVLTHALNDGAHAVDEYDSQFNLNHRIIYAPGIDQPVAFIKQGQTYFYHQDEQNSVIALSDSSGSIIEQYAYSPYGKSDDVSQLGNPLRYTARELDEDTGLYYYRARYYNVNHGRFIEPDPISYADSLNLYSYVSNNPINLVDPSGLYGQGALDLAGGALDEFTGGLTSGITSSLGVNQDSVAYSGGVIIAVANPKGLIQKVGKEAFKGVTKDIGGYTVGPYSKTKSHHIIQDSAVKNLPGYSRSKATAVDLGNIRDPNSAHRLTRPAQRERGGGTYASERRIGYKALRQAGVDKQSARQMIQESDNYFNSIGVTPSTITRIPGDRR